MLASSAMHAPLLLDTDIGTDVDDAIALALILASPEIDLRAVTTVSGDVQLRGQIAAKLLALAGRADVPIAAGVREPLLRQRNFLWLGHEGHGIVSAGERLPLRAMHAVDVLIEMVMRERPEVIAIGPLTNLAVAIIKEPAVIDAIPHLTVMGGILGRSAGLPLLEYNLASDAEAALVVLNAGIPTTLVPLDVTWQVFFTAAHLERLRRSSSRVVHAVCEAIDVWAPIQRAAFAATPGFAPTALAFLHDPLTVATRLDPSLVRLQRLALRPAIVEGMFQLREERDAPAFEVALAVDAPRCVEFVIERLLRLS